MSDTYQTHKAAIDIAYPTPPIDWARQDDHVTFGQDEVATVEVTFNGHAYHYLGAHRQLDGVEDWEILRVVAGGTKRTRAVGGYASWSDAKAAFEIYWEDPLRSAASACWRRRPTARTWSMTSPATPRRCGSPSCTLEA